MEYTGIYSSPLGPLYLTAGEYGLTGLTFSAPDNRPRRDDHPAFSPVTKWLGAYFQGIPLPIESLPLSPVGTEFQMQVWECLRRIPWGQTTTYGDIAREVARMRGKEIMSAQAVGQAVGANPVPIIVPCHRCVGAGGKLTGYGGGLEKKIWLLCHEGILREETK